ncbi:hypothetical protein K469DRAFT_241304 [Zopfia rhizophila CBS 207.26]|uniref:Uncharacterized protein n=1 Tax=Zopfia rhizophila CBS 207.26 TaxID=1314779 RepID=A0A6A6ESM5_9PEZI|nr:hypothetical protein K469DRAFT_241304 [Zopfia rhizophila CBS 207.26]
MSYPAKPVPDLIVGLAPSEHFTSLTSGRRQSFRFVMCHTEHVFHRPCHHWGRERFVGEPCIRSRVVNGRRTGCGYIECLGSVNSNELCSDCKYRQTRGGGWTPFADISNDGWAKIEERIRQRSMRLDIFPYIQDGKCHRSSKTEYPSL